MTWLKQEKAKFDKEDDIKKQKSKEASDAAKSRHESSCKSLENFVKTHLNELKGKKTKDGKKLKIKIKENEATVLAGDEPFLSVRFSFEEEGKYDSDGCYWEGTGRYYEQSYMQFNRKHMTRNNYEASCDWRELSEEGLAYYILLFVDL